MMKNCEKETTASGPTNFVLTTAIVKNAVKYNSPKVLDRQYGQMGYGYTGGEYCRYSCNGGGVYDVSMHGTCVDYVEAYATIKNITVVETVIELAIKFKINRKNPLEVSVPIEISDANYLYVPKEPPFNVIKTIPVVAPYNGIYYLVVVCKTELGIAHFPIHGRVINGKLVAHWGFNPNNIPLSSLDLINQNPCAQILLVDDISLAEKINKTLSRDCGNNPTLIAVAYWAGNSRIGKYNFKPLLGREVIFLPSLDRDSIIAGEKLKECLNEAGVSSFKILMQPVYEKSWDITAIRKDCGNYAIEKAIPATRIDIPYLLDNLGCAWELKQYKKFLIDEKLINNEEVLATTEQSIFRPASEVTKSGNNSSNTPSMDNVFSTSNISVVVGDSDAGKTLFIRGIAVALSSGVGFFQFEKSQPRSVYIINAEQDAEKSEGYTKRVMDSLEIKTIPALLFDCSILDANLPDDMPNFDIFTPQWQEYLLREIAHGSVVMVDNLLSTSLKNVNGNKIAQEMTLLAGKLRKKQITLIIVHHTGSTGESLGTSALESLSQNFITIHKGEGKSDGGVNAVVTFRKIKSYPKLRGKAYAARLPYAAPDEQGGPWEFTNTDEQEPNAEESTPSVKAEAEPRISKPDTAGLSEIQKDALNIAYDNSKVTKADLVDKGYKEGTIKDNLSKLLKSNLLVKRGRGKSSFYVLPEGQD